MAPKPWDQQTTDEKLDTLREDLDRLDKRVETAIGNFEAYADEIKKIIDDLTADVERLKAERVADSYKNP